MRKAGDVTFAEVSRDSEGMTCTFLLLFCALTCHSYFLSNLNDDDFLSMENIKVAFYFS